MSQSEGTSFVCAFQNCNTSLLKDNSMLQSDNTMDKVISVVSHVKLDVLLLEEVGLS